jgi:hypothetical protein
MHQVHRVTVSSGTVAPQRQKCFGCLVSRMNRYHDDLRRTYENAELVVPHHFRTRLRLCLIILVVPTDKSVELFLVLAYSVFGIVFMGEIDLVDLALMTDPAGVDVAVTEFAEEPALDFFGFQLRVTGWAETPDVFVLPGTVQVWAATGVARLRHLARVIATFLGELRESKYHYSG